MKREKTGAALTSVFAAIGLVVTKVIVGVMTGPAWAFSLSLPTPGLILLPRW
jgi:hypothetical protein